MVTRWKQDREVAQLIEHLNAEDKFEQPNVLTAAEQRAILSELDRCRKDFIYAARNYFWISNKDREDQLFSLWPSQELILEKIMELRAKGMAQKLIIIKSRQLGCSTLIEALVAWRTMFFANVNALVVSYDRDHASEVLFPIMLFIYDRMPWWMKPECSSRQGDKGLFFENRDPAARAYDPGLNSHIYVKGANAVTGVGQGIRLGAVHASEFADWPDAKAKEIIGEDMVNALVESADTFAILESTAKGANRYAHHLWKKNVERGVEAEWFPLFLPWFFDATHVRQLTPAWIPEPAEIRMRDRAREDWLKCDNENCKQYHYRFVVKLDRSDEACPTCSVGTLHPYDLTDRQLKWMEHRRKTAEVDDDSLKKLKQEQCFIGRTNISCENGIVPISKGSKCRMSDSGRITAWYDNGTRDTVRLATKFGRELICTPDQKIFLPSGECKEIQYLELDEEIALAPPRFSESYYTAEWDYTPGCKMHVVIDEDWGRLLGYFMGDGCWAAGIRFACDAKDGEVSEDIAKLCEKLIGHPSRIVLSKSKKMNDVYSNTLQWKRIMWGLGCLKRRPSDGNPIRFVNVPECIFSSPKSVVKQFLSALFECDGHAYRTSPKSVLFTCHPEFAKDVQLLLLGFGINAGVREENKTKVNENGNSYTYIGRNIYLRGEASNVFHREIGFISNRKRSTACVRPPRINTMRWHRNQMSDWVVSVTPDEPQQVFDITVEETHRFSANGILVHNCLTAEESFQVSGYQVFGLQAQEWAAANVKHPIFCGFFDNGGVLHGYITRKDDFSEWGQKIYTGGRKCVAEGCEVNHEYDDMPLDIYEWPKKEFTYCCGADVAEGLGGRSAYSVGCVIRYSLTGGADYQVAVWRSNTVDPISFAQHLYHLGMLYNEALMSIEANRYDICLGHLRMQFQYSNIYRWKHLDSMNVLSQKLGWWTNLSSRPRLWQTFKKWLQSQLFYVRSRNLVEEMKNFVKDSDDATMAGGDNDEPDDELMACHPKGVLIRTKHCLKPIEDVMVGDLVLTHTGRFMPVEAIHSRTATALYELTAWGRQPLRLTGNHPLYLWEKYRQYHHNGKQVCWNRFRNPSWIAIDEADGCLRRYASCGTFPKEVIDRLYVEMKEFVPAGYQVLYSGEQLAFTRQRNGFANGRARWVPWRIPVDRDFLRMIGYYLAEGGKGNHTVTFASHYREAPVTAWLSRYLKQLGLKPLVKHKGNGTYLTFSSVVMREFFAAFGVLENKHLPEWVELLPPEKQREVVIGYLLGDGCFRVRGGGITAATVSPKIAYQIIEMSGRSGWPTSVQKHDGQNGHREQWHISWSSSTAAAIKQDIEPEILACKRPFERVRKSKSDKVRLQDGYLVSPIRKAVELPFSGNVYNIRVAEDNSYVADGTVVHNCQIALYTAHEADWNDNLGGIPVSNDLNETNAKLDVHCLRCGHQWWADSLQDEKDPDKFKACPKCNALTIESVRNPNVRPDEDFINQAWAEATAWQPERGVIGGAVDYEML